MLVGSLFSGIGGLDLGLERAGMRVVWQAESDPYCRAVLKKHWPDVPCYEDVRDIGADAPRVDLICGGFPCQPVSLAGARRAQADERWLWPEFERIIRLVRPRYVLVENVPGLLVRGMGDVLGGLAALGFDAEWESIPASALGAPHRRDRVWIVAYSQGAMADSAGARLSSGSRLKSGAIRNGPRSSEPERRSSDVADSNGGRRAQRYSQERDRFVFNEGSHPERDATWATEPEVGRLAHGLSPRLARAQLTALGNAVVPQVAQWIGESLMAYESESGDA